MARRNGISILLVGLTPLSAEAQTCVASSAGLVGWWPGNGTVQDSVAGNNGQPVGDATFTAAVVQQGFKLDGLGDYVEIPDSSALKPTHISVEAWVRFYSMTTPIVSQFGAVGLQYVVFKKNSRVFNFDGYALRKQRDNGVDRFAFSVADVNKGGGNTRCLFDHSIGRRRVLPRRRNVRRIIGQGVCQRRTRGTVRSVCNR